ncbi:MAG: hypothetical protein PHI62_04235 [Candidatus Methanomethylophilaceae archaeon]|jgi:hypothetical protein|nr:hypothetical protein [Candidatus Methanomethylophilaceae archaeon]
MDQQTLTRATLIIAVLAIVCSAASVYIATTNEPPTPGDELVEKYTVYFGLNDSDETNARNSQNRIGEIVAAECNTGYTTYLASGGSLIDGILVKDDYTAVFVIVFVEEKDVRSAIDAVCEELGLKVVLLEKQYAKEDLILKS